MLVGLKLIMIGLIVGLQHLYSALSLRMQTAEALVVSGYDCPNK